MSTGRAITVVTGAAGGLGVTLTETLLAANHRVAAVDRATERLGPLARANPGALALLTFDARQRDAWREPLARIEGELGAPNGLVLLAGGWAGGAPVAEQSDDTVLHRMLELNFETAHAALAAVIPGMVARKTGSIVVIGSRAVERPWESAGSAAYAASKSALVTYAQSIAAEVRDHGVRVNAVLPSTIDTAANRAAMPDAEPRQWVAPAKLAQVIGFLLSDDASEITGAAIPVYGRV